MKTFALMKLIPSLFTAILNISLSASYVAIAVLLVRLAIRKAPKWTNCFLWGIVGLKLICPFSIESSFSLLPSSRVIQTEKLSEQGSELLKPMIIDVVNNPVYKQAVSVELSSSVSKGIDFITIMSLIWFAGVIAMIAYAVISDIALRRKLSDAVIFDKGIKLTDKVGTPFLLGVFKQNIFIPFSLAEEDRKYVVEHEKAHIKRKDYLWKPLGFILLSIYWFNPIIWVAYYFLCRDIESACDEKVIRNMHEEDRQSYSRALLNCSIKQRMISVCPLSFGEEGVKERVENIMSYKKPAVWIVCIAVILCAVFAVCFLTNPAVANSNENTIVENNNQEQEISEANYSWVWPCDGKRISVPFGKRILPITNEISVCNHINIVGEKGDPVYAACFGEVVKAEYSAEYGNYIEIKHAEETTSQYWHLDEISVSVGQQVLSGDIIGIIGASGMATGPNLGFCLIKNGEYVDPLSMYDIQSTDYYKKGIEDLGSVPITKSDLKILAAESHVDYTEIVLQYPDGSIKGGYTFTEDATIQIDDEVYPYPAGILKLHIGDNADTVDIEFASGLISKIVVQ